MPTPLLAIFGITSALAQAIAAGTGAVSASAGWAWSRAPLSRAKRQARRAVRPLEKEARRYRRVLRDRDQAARTAAEGWADAQREVRADTVPLDTLRAAGARNVRWAALEEAGFTSVGKVLAASSKELAAVHGIGRLTAARVQRAAKQLAERLDDEPPALPSPELDDERALPLAASAVSLLEARDVAGPEPERLAVRADDLSERLEPVAEEASFRRWLVAPFRRRHRQQAMADAQSLQAEADELAGTGLLERAAEGRERLRKSPPLRHASADAVRKVFRDRYAECCALLEQIFGRMHLGAGSVSTRGKGGVTDEVARRVEAQRLDVSSIGVTLRRYQVFGAKYLLAQERTVLGDEMGLGKTLQALAAMSHLADREKATRFAVVAPASLMPNWCREIERFTRLVPHKLHGDELEPALAAWAHDGGVAVTSFDTLRRLDLGASLANSGGVIDLLIVDEAHFVKNPEAQRTQATQRLAERSRRVCFMSGTPMENRPEEFLNLIQTVTPEKGAELRNKELHIDAAAGSVRRFHEAVSSVYLRRNQEDVLSELPERIEVEEWVDLLPGDRAAYSESVAVGNFMGMRQAATMGRGKGPSAKLERLAELLEEHRASGRKVIVFSYFLKVLAAVERQFGAVGVVSGKVPVEERQAMVDALGEADGHALLLLQITAGGAGLNIQAASAVVLLEPQTKPSTEAQAIARSHRMGQTRAVLVHRLLARNTCDETMLLLLAEKQQLFDAYARKSAVKDASRQATERSLSKAVVQAEQARLAQSQAAAETQAG